MPTEPVTFCPSEESLEELCHGKMIVVDADKATPECITMSRHRRGILGLLAAACLLCSLPSCEMHASSPADEQAALEESLGRPTPSREASKWLAIAENGGKNIQDRIKAVYELEQLKEPATVDRLIELLPGDYGAYTLRVAAALGAIKDPRAVPALKKIYNEENVVVPGKIRAVVHYAIRECGGDSNKP